jgi:predicted transcriptional regulator
MKSILHTLFPDVRAQILLHLFSERPREYYVRELARSTTLRLSTVQKELSKLSRADLVGSRSNGYLRYYRANQRHRLFRILQELVSSDRAAIKFVNPHGQRRKKVRRARRRNPSTFISSLGIKRKMF